jgi:Bifunctional DNA primase/polymerase, N-terminal
MTTNLNLALDYSSRDIPIFPCSAVDKTPIPSNGFKAATTNERIIRIWWDRHPDAMVGMPTGERTGVFVLDVDVKSGGFETLAALEAEHGPLPATRAVRTGSGGRHFYFNHVGLGNSAGRLHGRGIDVRGQGGFVIAAGNTTADGRIYELVEDAGPVAAPDWLLSLIKPRPYAPQPHRAMQAAGSNPAYCDRAINSELATLSAARQGNRNEQLNRSGFAIGQFVGAGAISEEDAFAEMERIAAGWPNLSKSRATIRRALHDGMQRPRLIPIDTTPAVDISRLIANLAKKAKREAAE